VILSFFRRARVAATKANVRSERMADTAVIIGGTQGLGRELAAKLAARGEQVFLSGRDQARTNSVASAIAMARRVSPSI
jgi:short-subunit dehydrogenase